MKHVLTPGRYGRHGSTSQPDTGNDKLTDKSGQNLCPSQEREGPNVCLSILIYWLVGQSVSQVVRS